VLSDFTPVGKLSPFFANLLNKRGVAENTAPRAEIRNQNRREPKALPGTSFWRLTSGGFASQCLGTAIPEMRKSTAVKESQNP
jgi:hypothetical protein